MFDGVDDKKKAADIREASMIRLIGKVTLSYNHMECIIQAFN